MFFLGWQGIYAFIGLVAFITIGIIVTAKLIK